MATAALKNERQNLLYVARHARGYTSRCTAGSTRSSRRHLSNMLEPSNAQWRLPAQPATSNGEVHATVVSMEEYSSSPGALNDSRCVRAGGRSHAMR